MVFAALFFVRLQHGVLFPCLQLGLFPCLLPDGSSQQRPCRQRLPDGAPFRQVAFLAGASCRARFPRSSAAPLPAASLPLRRPLPAALPRRTVRQHLCHCGAPCQQLRHGAPAGNIFPMALCHSAAILFAMALPASSSAMALPASNIFPMALRCSVPAGSPLCRRSPACNSFATAPLPATSLIGAPASNKPHPAEKSTPVWLAIWRTWAGFANSQHRDAAFTTPDNICAHSSLLQH